MTGNPASTDSQRQIAEQISAQQLRLLLLHTSVGTIAATAFAVFLAYHLRQGALGAAIHPEYVDAWIQLKIGTAIIRIVHSFVYRHCEHPDHRKWLRDTTTLLAIDGAVWGIGCTALIHEASELATFITAVACCVASVATFGLQISFRATAAYVVPIIGPIAVAYFLRGDQVGLLAGVGISIFLLLLLATGRRSEKRMAEVFRLRIETERISQERAEALELARMHSSAKDQFLAVVSHELRTPLHGILGLTRLTQSEVPPSDVTLHFRLGLIEEAGEHLQRMVNDLLDISMIKSGRLDLVVAPFDLPRQLDLLRATYQTRANECGVQFRIATSGDVISPVEGDAVRIAQVLNNLLGNAFKFTPLGGKVALTVARARKSDIVEFEIEDTGPGIPAEEMSRVFEIFTQGHHRPVARPEGVGLGLAIARQLANAMGGDVTCRSQVGKGSVFTFSVPLPLASTPPVESTTVSPTANRSRTLFGTGHTVAIADDDSNSSLVCGSVLRRIGCNVEEFANGRVLLDRILRRGAMPDLIVMDWDMPHIDGPTATQRIRAHEKAHGLQPVPIIGISANASSGSAKLALEAGMNSFIAKPCPPDEIARIVESLLPHGKGWRGRPAPRLAEHNRFDDPAKRSDTNENEL
ncbi:hybrid sensor histidine kinase/response regulator [Piscinibacter sakaiensis]|uniref:hybrid sensor histidine kinase/response regulator n=1 Tax=Piscinibacter sakaiensis TaxID=1547922 RepID=UPI003AADBF0A